MSEPYRSAVPEIHPKTPWRWLTARPPSTLLARHLQEPVTWHPWDGRRAQARSTYSPTTVCATCGTAAQPYANTTKVKDFDAKFGDLLRPASA